MQRRRARLRRCRHGRDDRRRVGSADAFPGSRPAQPSEIADVVGYLLSDRSAYITGETIDVDGGGIRTSRRSCETSIRRREGK